MSQLIFCTEIDECASDPCQNGGTCYDRPAGYHCECPIEWRSHHCECRYKQCSMFFVVCSLFFVLCCLLFVVCSLFFVVCCLLLFTSLE